MRRRTKTRTDAEIEKALSRLHRGITCYREIFGEDADYKVLTGIDLTLHWVLGEDSQFQELLRFLGDLNQAQAQALAKISKEEIEHDASRSN